VFRHSALFRLGATTPGQRDAMLQGLASLLEECPSVRAGDYGERLFPAAAAGGYDVALHLDFDDAAGYAAYVAHPTHLAVSAFNASLAIPDSTVRIDWCYGGPPRVQGGRVRHCEVFVWAETAPAGARTEALRAVNAFADTPGLLSLLVAEDAGDDPRAADWILDLELPDAAAARAFLDGHGYRAAAAAVAAAVDASRTARITHLEAAPRR
jgi:hypothetical protein